MRDLRVYGFSLKHVNEKEITEKKLQGIYGFTRVFISILIYA